jgi:GxxExxY protein
MFFRRPRITRVDANQMTEIIYKSERYAIIGACFEVYNEKGCGFLEPVYQECLGIEFEFQRIPAIAKPSLTLSYRGRILTQTYQPDYVCFEKIIVELKAVSALADEHRGQLLNYLHATGFELGLLVNFGHYPGFGIRTHCENAAHKKENRLFRCISLIYSR